MILAAPWFSKVIRRKQGPRGFTGAYKRPGARSKRYYLLAWITLHVKRDYQASASLASIFFARCMNSIRQKKDARRLRWDVHPRVSILNRIRLMRKGSIMA